MILMMLRLFIDMTNSKQTGEKIKEIKLLNTKSVLEGYQKDNRPYSPLNPPFNPSCPLVRPAEQELEKKLNEIIKRLNKIDL